MDLRSRLNRLASRKAQDRQILDDIRAGKYNHVSTAAEFFAEAQALEPTPDAVVPPAAESAPSTSATELERGHVVSDSGSRFVLIDANYEPGGEGAAAFGRVVFGDSPVPALLPDFAAAELPLSPDVGRIGFLDTETTGLVGGTGCVAFLVGVGWWERGPAGWRFRLEQYLIEDYCHEPLMLERLCARLADFEVLVTYNGKCFDIPLLRTRAIMNRLPPRLLKHRQMDLLQPSRRLWRGMLQDVSLKRVERDILGVERGPDIDGSLIPELFQQLARTGRCAHLQRIVDHNAQDIVSLASLLAHLGDIAADPLGSARVTHWRECASLARWREQRRDGAAAAALYNRALERCREELEEQALMARLALLHKRLRQWTEALELWNTLTRLPVRRAAPAWLELAKYHEHVAKDPAGALAVVERCRRQSSIEVQMGSYLDGKVADDLRALEQELQKREARLRARIERLAARRRLPAG